MTADQVFEFIGYSSVLKSIQIFLLQVSFICAIHCDIQTVFTSSFLV
jgi:hypothetical protein